jgi:hypothetical protein
MGFSWHWHRMRAMTAGEVWRHAQRRLHQFTDSGRTWTSTRLALEGIAAFPRLPKAEDAPGELREALSQDAQKILAGTWKAFGHLDLRIDDPPKWQYDYLAARDFATTERGFTLNHRELPGGADVKLIWELNRWHQLVRLAMASYVLRDEAARNKCLQWLEDWVVHNPPYRGWNWTSALEVGIRLVQFTWIDPLLGHCAPAATTDRLRRLRQAVLPPHAWYAWRYRSFGSSANNHLLGELAGCLLAIVRWPHLAELVAPLEKLQPNWEREVLAQFARDGGNKEQALNYHLFSFELCWQVLKAFDATGRHVSASVRERLTRASEFFRDVQVSSEPWDYGDSDSAFVTPFFALDAVAEWHRWLVAPTSITPIRYWIGDPPCSDREPGGVWKTYPDTGVAVLKLGPWWLRWDLSPLGYLSTAAHGHLDALHLSLWLRGVAFVVDPGTGAYYSDPDLRARLSSRSAHNAPCPDGLNTPHRMGPFLWVGHHPRPRVQVTDSVAAAELDLGDTRIRRRINGMDGRGWQVEDECLCADGRSAPFTVRWQFAPGTQVTEFEQRKFSAARGGAAITIEVGPNWAATALGEGVVSPAFRKACPAPFLELKARPSGDEHGHFRTTFLACAPT